MYTIWTGLEYKLELIFKVILTPSNQSTEILQSLYLWVRVKHKPPEVNVMFGTILDVLL
jgi:hypothetical protein